MGSIVCSDSWDFVVVVLDVSNTVQHLNTNSASSAENQDHYKSLCYRRQEDGRDKDREKYITRRKCFQNSLFTALPTSYRSHGLLMLHIIVKIVNTSLLQNIILISRRVIQMKAIHWADS
jgi:hypothetical protein